jgi:antirestriction protein ArdC
MNVYEIVTGRILQSLENGVIPWDKPWKAEDGSIFPSNYFTRNQYRGLNILLLWLASMQYSSLYWLTFRQALNMGGHVRKGEKGSMIVFYKPLDEEKDEESSEEKARRSFVLRYSTVFNISQCEGLPEPPAVAAMPAISPIERCEKIVSGWEAKPRLVLDSPTQTRAFYRTATDTIYMPVLKRFVEPEQFYATLFHEMVHSTGISSRLNREMGGNFGSDPYSREELVAEMGSAFLCAIAAIDNDHVERNTTAYVQNWIQLLKGDSRLVMHAASQAQRAVDFILGAQAIQEQPQEAVAA